MEQGNIFQCEGGTRGWEDPFTSLESAETPLTACYAGWTTLSIYGMDDNVLSKLRSSR